MVLKTEESAVEVVHEHGYAFGFVNDYQFLKLEELKAVDAVVVNSYTSAMTSHLIRRIRSSADTYIYLLPVFIWGDFEALPVAIKQVIDGTLSASHEVKQKTEMVSRIQQNMQNFW